MEIWAASTFWQWITPLWTWVYKYLFETLLSLLLGINPEVQFLVQMVVLFLIFWGKHLTVSYGGCTALRSDQQYTSVSVSLDPCQHLVFSRFVCLFVWFFLFGLVWLTVAIQVSVRQYLTVALISFPRLLMIWSIFHVLVGHLCIFFGEKSVCLNPLPIFQSRDFFFFFFLSCRGSLYILDIAPY